MSLLFDLGPLPRLPAQCPGILPHIWHGGAGRRLHDAPGIWRYIVGMYDHTAVAQAVPCFLGLQANVQVTRGAT